MLMKDENNEVNEKMNRKKKRTIVLLSMLVLMLAIIGSIIFKSEMFRYDENKNTFTKVGTNLTTIDPEQEESLIELQINDQKKIYYREYYYNEDGSINCYVVYEQDKEGNLLFETSYELDGRFNYEYEYDKNGNIIKSVTYGVPGSMNYYCTYEYDENGNLLTEYSFRCNSVMDHIIKYEYDKDEKKIKHYFYDDNSVIKNFKEYIYNQSGKLGKTICYDSDGKMIAYYIYTYNDYGKLIRKTRYNADSSISNYIEYEYRNYRLIRSTIYALGEHSWHIVSEYDEDGNIIKDLHYSDNENLSTYEIITYDGNGNEINWIRYNADGTIWNE